MNTHKLKSALATPFDRRMKSLSRANARFRPLTVVLPIERIMKEAIKMVLQTIYDREYPETAHVRASSLGRRLVLTRIEEEWRGEDGFVRLPDKNFFNNINRHRLIPILKEEIDDPQFFYFIQKVLYPRRLGAKLPDTIPRSVVLSVVLGNIYLHKRNQEIRRIQQQYEIPMAEKIRSILRTGPPIDDQQNSGEEESSNAPQDDKATIMRRIKSNQRKAVFASLVSSYYKPTSTLNVRVWDQKRPSFSI